MTTTPTTRRTVCYVRVSTDDQATEGYSLDEQARACRLYVESRVAMGEAGWTAITDDAVYADPGVSGATRERAALRRLLDDAKAGTIGRVVVTKLDRMSRRAADLLAIEEELDTYGVERTYIKDSIDTSTPVGRLLRTVLAAVAELERDVILERTRAGRLEAARRGDVWRSTGLLGYRYVAVDKATGQKGRLEIDPATAPLVQRVFREVANGMSLHALAARLNAEGVPTCKGGAMWRHNALQRIITNPAYTGKATYGKWRRVKGANGKTVNRLNDPDDVVYIDIPALVSPELAAAACAALARNKVMAKRNAKREYLLGGGLVRCGVVLEDGRTCGSVMRGEDHHGAAYRCNHQTPAGLRRHSIPAAVLEDRVWDALQGALLDPDTVLAEVEALATTSSVQAVEAAAEVARLDRAAAEIAEQQDRLLDLYLSRRLDADAYAAKADALTAKRQQTRDRQAAVEARRDAAVARQLPIAEVKAACAQLAERLDTLTFERRQYLVRTLVHRIVATREGAKIEGVFDTLSGAVALDGAIVDTTPAHCARRRRRPPGHA